MIYTKPIAIIYNPSSGKKRDLRGLITQRLEMEKLPYEILLSTRKFMTWKLAEEADLDKYSILVAVGGDGTYHEVVNGMLHRADKKRIPVAFIPNGSGNDTLRSFGVFDVAKALDYLVKGDIIKVDVTKVLIDYESEDQIPADQRESNLRYQLVNSALSLTAKINNRASSWKWCCCCNPYQIAALIELAKVKHDPLDLYCDGELLLSNFETCLAMTLTGKYTGNGMFINPTGLINDGQMEFVYFKQKLPVKQLVNILE